MLEAPSLADYPVHRGDIARELCLLDELARFKRGLGLKALQAGDLKTGAVSLLQGIGFYRCWELPLVVSYFQPEPGTQILDVGSLKSILPVYWASLGCLVSVIDIDPAVMVQQKYARVQEVVMPCAARIRGRALYVNGKPCEQVTLDCSAFS